MIAKIEKDAAGKDELVIRLPIQPRPSGSGKTILVASTNGNTKTELQVNGKTVTIGVNAYTAKE